MGKNITKILLFICCLGIAISYPISLSGKEFVVVIDPGHGGHDPGAVGKISKEKNINLNVALQVGKKIQNNCKDVKVIYTRQKDVFVPLDKRAQIANNAKADLFISIHTNAVGGKKIVRGAETFTLGLARSQANLEIAKRENSVIEIEDNYEQRYAGFNPNSSESYIIFEFIQDKYMEQSVNLAKLIQDEFSSYAKRNNRGVHQAGFLVLRATTMPSVLIELGYISTLDEERYLNSKEGIEKLSESIYRAFLNYKKEHFKQSTTAPQIAHPVQQVQEQNSNKLVKTENSNDLIFMIQILTSSKQLATKDKQFKGLSPVGHYKENGLYKYTYLETKDYNQALKEKKAISSKFKDAFIIAFKKGKKINIQEAIKEFKNKK